MTMLLLLNSHTGHLLALWCTYLAIGSCPDISLPTQKLSQFLDCYTDIHYNAALHVVHYMGGTWDLSLNLGGDNPTQLLCFSDASYSMCPDTWRSTSGYCFTLGLGIVSWVAIKQKTIAQATMDAEYITLHECLKEAIWLCALLSSIELTPIHLFPILADNNRANIHNWAKHIDIKFNVIHDALITAISWLPMYSPMTTLPTSLQKPCHPGQLHAYETLWASSDSSAWGDLLWLWFSDFYFYSLFSLDFILRRSVEIQTGWYRSWRTCDHT